MKNEQNRAEELVCTLPRFFIFGRRRSPFPLNFQLPRAPFLCLSDKYEARIFTNFTKRRDKKRKVCYNEIDIGTGALRAVRQFL